MSDTTETGYAPSWKFKDSKAGKADGTVFEGRFNGNIEMADTKFGAKPVAGFVQEGTGKEYSIWIFNTALSTQLKKARPEEGDLVRIEYKGERTSKAGNDYQDFKVTNLTKPVVKPTWDDLGSEDDEEEL